MAPRKNIQNKKETKQVAKSKLKKNPKTLNEQPKPAEARRMMTRDELKAEVELTLYAHFWSE